MGMKRVVVKEYRDEGWFWWVNPIRLTVFLCTLGIKGRWRNKNQVMERDANRMRAQGYRIAGDNGGGNFLFGGNYIKVTYELIDPPR